MYKLNRRKLLLLWKNEGTGVL